MPIAHERSVARHFRSVPPPGYDPEQAGDAHMTGTWVRLAESVRGDVVESVHYGVVAVADADGRLVAGWGDVDTVTYPRSSLKPIQAVGLVESGAFDALGLDEAHLAMACASHRGEPEQVALVGDWLQRLGLPEEMLCCGLDLPADAGAAEAHLRAGGARSRVFHNCSGKHCGFLSLARHKGWDLGSYSDVAHPGQRLYREVLSELLGRDADSLPAGIDGCTLPTIALSVADAARAFARFAAARVAGEGRRAAIRRIQAAMRNRPDLLSGRGQATEIIVRHTGGRIILKGGAEAFLLAMAPKEGLAVALKIADGNSRGRMLALVEVLLAVGLVTAADADALRARLKVALRNSAGDEVGHVRACALTTADRDRPSMRQAGAAE
jgi:L-asparaginase II